MSLQLPYFCYEGPDGLFIGDADKECIATVTDDNIEVGEYIVLACNGYDEMRRRELKASHDMIADLNYWRDRALKAEAKRGTVGDFQPARPDSRHDG